MAIKISKESAKKNKSSNKSLDNEHLNTEITHENNKKDEKNVICESEENVVIENTFRSNCGTKEIKGSCDGIFEINMSKKRREKKVVENNVAELPQIKDNSENDKQINSVLEDKIIQKCTPCFKCRKYQ